MKKYSTLVVSMLALTLLLSECKSTKTATTTAPATEKPAPSPADGADISAGQVLFTTKCDRCHMQPTADKHNDAGWRQTMSTMGPKAHLSDAQTAQVLKYLYSVSGK